MSATECLFCLGLLFSVVHVISLTKLLFMVVCCMVCSGLKWSARFCIQYSLTVAISFTR